MRRSNRLARKSPPVGPAPPLRIVSIGGGTGLSTLLRGLKRYVKAAEGSLELTAVVTVTDDGGSSGRLRREFDVLPPGDIRNCMVALSEYEGLIARLFQYRFSSGRGLKGHSFGNLFLTAMTDLTATSRTPSRSPLRCSPCWAASIRRPPPTWCSKPPWPTAARSAARPHQPQHFAHRAHLAAAAQAQASCRNAARHRQRRSHHPGPRFAIHQRDPEPAGGRHSASHRELPALKAYFVNLMWQPGETTNFRASDHVAGHPAPLRQGT